MWRFRSVSTNYQLGPRRTRRDYKEATERITSFAIREGRSVEHILKVERHRTDALDPDLEKWLIWLSENWPTYFANDGSPSSSSSSTFGNYSWWTGNSKCIGMTTTGTTTNGNLQKVRWQQGGKRERKTRIRAGTQETRRHVRASGNRCYLAVIFQVECLV